MRPPLPLAAAAVVLTATLSVVALPAPHALAAPAGTAYALSGTTLLQLDPAAPQQTISTGILGVNAGETLVGIDVRPQNGQLYALGVNAAANTASVYLLHEQTGYAAVIGTPGSVAMTTDGATTVDLPDSATVGYGFDVNPAADRLRVSAGGLNFRVNPNTGAAIDGDLGGAAGSVAGVNPDGSTKGATTTVDASAYTNAVANNGNVTTLYTLDAASDSLYLQSPPNSGTQVSQAAVTLGGNPLDFTAISGFDIDPAVATVSSNAPVTSGSGYAVLNVGGTTGLYTINLVTGQATSVGPVGNGVTAVQGLALQRRAADAGLPVIGLDAAGSNLLRTQTSTPGTLTTQALNLASLTPGESLAAITWRVQTGQLYGLGVNATLNSGTLYVVDPQTGTLTAVQPNGLSWSGDGITPVDLPDPATTGYGFDANPTVDRFRVVAGTFNARVSPTGLPVDGDNGGGAGSVLGTNPDGAPASPLSATAYTNSFGSDLAPGKPTTQYVLDAATDRLLVQNPPNAGTLTLPTPVTLDGTPLNFTAIAGLDIGGTVSVATSGVRATGGALAALTVGGTTGLYRIDLTTAKATALGAVGAGATPLRSIAVAEAGYDTVVAPTRVPAKLVKVAAAKQVKARVDTGRVLTCPAAFVGSRCSVTVKLTGAGTTLGSSATKVAKGAQKRLSVSLSKAGRQALRSKGTIRATIAITFPGGPQAAKKTIRFKLTLKSSKL